MASLSIKVKNLGKLKAKYNALGIKLKSVHGTIANNVKYGPWVGNERFQAAIHRKRWPTDEGTLKENKQEITKDFQAAIDAALRSPSPIMRNPLLLAMDSAIKRVHADMTLAPPPPSGSKYRRTGTYIRGFTTLIEED